MTSICSPANLALCVGLHLDLFKCREACKLDPKYIVNFGEEVVRGQPVFVLSLLLQKLEPMLRSAAGVAPWQVGLDQHGPQCTA